MTTHLLVATQHPAAHWSTALPTALVLEETEQPPWQHQGNQWTWQQNIPVQALRNIREVLPCLSLRTEASWGYQCMLEYEAVNGTRGRCILAPMGNVVNEYSGEDGVQGVRADVDIWRIEAPLKMAVLHWHVQYAGPIADLPALLSVSLRADGPPPAPKLTQGHLAHDVPARSQMQLRSDIANRVCSPTSVSMLLDYYGKSVDVYDVIDEAQHQPSGLYGVWPANIWAASRRGLMGYLLHVPSWETARELLDAGYPLIASVRYDEGELRNGAARKTNGHLLVVRGYENHRVWVNDPAADCDGQVARTYDLSEFCTVWLERSAVGYVLFTP